MSNLIWEDPPVPYSRTGSAEHFETVAALRAKPMSWAKIIAGAKSNSRMSAIRRGALVAYRPVGSFEARSVSVEGGFDIYVRYIGETSASS